MFSFIDVFSGYNQIKMDPSDAEKTAFRTPMVNFHCIVMSFGMNNAGATYQRAITVIFHDMLIGCLEEYVDDSVVKSKEVDQHIDNLRKVCSRVASTT